MTSSEGVLGSIGTHAAQRSTAERDETTQAGRKVPHPLG